MHTYLHWADIARRPDLIVSDKKGKLVEIFEVACCLDRLIKESEEEKYLTFAADMSFTARTSVVVYPVVIGCIGSVKGVVSRLHLCEKRACYSISSEDVNKEAFEEA